MTKVGVWDPVSGILWQRSHANISVVKTQTYKTAIEAACMLLRVDDIVSGISKKKEGGAGAQPQEDMESMAD